MEARFWVWIVGAGTADRDVGERGGHGYSDGGRFVDVWVVLLIKWWRELREGRCFFPD